MTAEVFPMESLLGLIIAGAVVYLILGIINLKRADDE